MEMIAETANGGVSLQLSVSSSDSFISESFFAHDIHFWQLFHTKL